MLARLRHTSTCTARELLIVSCFFNLEWPLHFLIFECILQTDLLKKKSILQLVLPGRVLPGRVYRYNTIQENLLRQSHCRGLISDAMAKLQHNYALASTGESILYVIIQTQLLIHS
jgi:hypothetical protein